MKRFDLELRVYEHGSVLAKEVILEDVTNRNMVVHGWQQGQGYIFKFLQNFQIKDSVLDVFVGCQGISGGMVTCEVYINNKGVGRIHSMVVNRFYAHMAFPII